MEILLVEKYPNGAGNTVYRIIITKWYKFITTNVYEIINEFRHEPKIISVNNPIDSDPMTMLAQMKATISMI